MRLGWLLFILLLFNGVLIGCMEQSSQSYPSISRESTIPSSAEKITPETDAHPPLLYSDEWNEPIPLPPPINTAGAEDSPFITADGTTLYFFFTPDVTVPVEQQLLDNVTGIYMSVRQNQTWSTPIRVWLQDPGRLSMDGAEYVQDTRMWFASAREGYTGVHWFTASFRNGQWCDWKNADFPQNLQVGELHFLNNETKVYFHSNRTGGVGGLDLWVSEKENATWQEPRNIIEVNTPRDEGWPYVTSDGNELWFTRDYGIWRSLRENDSWREPELILSPLAGECTLDTTGNIYFVHHFYQNDTMIEADIYVATRKQE
jgi:hypothetical protein